MPPAWLSATDDLMALLKERGVRPSAHRYAVVQCFAARREPLSFEALLAGVRAELPAVSPQTLRRTLLTLCDAGLIIREESAGQPYRLGPLAG